MLDSSGTLQRVNPQKVYRLRRRCAGLCKQRLYLVWVDAAAGYAFILLAVRQDRSNGRERMPADLPPPARGKRQKLHVSLWSNVSRTGGGGVGQHPSEIYCA
jgi:hypothetical protein